MPERTVFVIDDDEAVRDSLGALLELADLKVRTFASAESFLADPEIVQGGCVVADVRMPGMSGVELQEEIQRRDLPLPVIIVTGHGDVPLAVRAMKSGAIDFLEKPFDDEAMLASVRRGLAQGRDTRERAAGAKAAQEALCQLTQREREVLEHLISGKSNKIVAYELGISPRTVEIHRAHLMEKLKARNLSDLVRVALAAGVQVPVDK